jgi:hypothetical protein
VEEFIERDYTIDHPNQNISFGKWAKIGEKAYPNQTYEVPPLYRAKPDILNNTKKKYNEIKPFTKSGIEAAKQQMSMRLKQFEGTDYVPDIVWAPPIGNQPYAIGNYQVYVFNIVGVLYYSEIEITQPKIEDYIKITLVAAATTAATVATLAATSSYFFAASGAQYTLMNALPIIASLVEKKVEIDTARLEAHTPVASSLTTAGKAVGGMMAASVAFSFSFF